MNPTYVSARAAFAEFRTRMLGNTAVAGELEAAIEMLRSSYDAAIYENRFIVGGAAEHIMVAAFNGAGLPAQHVGRGDTRIDMTTRCPDGTRGGFSIKASFSTLNVRMINTLGGSEAQWEEPTMFLFEKIGLVYADPELLPDATVHTKDAVLLDGKRVKAYIQAHPDNVIPFAFAKPGTGSIPSSKTASEDVARSIVRNFSRLSLP